jgi:hypothetical protein
MRLIDWCSCLPKNTSFGKDLNFRGGKRQGAAYAIFVKKSLHRYARFAALLVGLCVVSFVSR